MAYPNEKSSAELQGGQPLNQTATYDSAEKGGTSDDIPSNALMSPSGAAGMAHKSELTNVDEASRGADLLMRDEILARNVASGRWKLDVRVVPALMLLWLANFIAPSNAGNARIAVSCSFIFSLRLLLTVTFVPGP